MTFKLYFSFEELEFPKKWNQGYADSHEERFRADTRITSFTKATIMMIMIARTKNPCIVIAL